MSSIIPLLEIMKRLRDPVTGCEWDKVQTFGTIAPYTIEEAYEVADAIERGDMDALKDELGDLLLQVVFHSQIASDEGRFEFDDVVEAICNKMERRHPHIFGDAEESPGWEELKARERDAVSGAKSKDSETSPKKSAIDGVAMALPALLRAQKIQKRAARVGFDWPEEAPVKAKLLEELAEVDAAETPEALHEEIGDLLFSAVNLARHHGVDAETALKDASTKFSARFRGVEARLGGDLSDKSLDEMEDAWQAVKAAPKTS